MRILCLFFYRRQKTIKKRRRNRHVLLEKALCKTHKDVGDRMTNRLWPKSDGRPSFEWFDDFSLFFFFFILFWSTKVCHQSEISSIVVDSVHFRLWHFVFHRIFSIPSLGLGLTAMPFIRAQRLCVRLCVFLLLFCIRMRCTCLTNENGYCAHISV